MLLNGSRVAPETRKNDRHFSVSDFQQNGAGWGGGADGFGELDQLLGVNPATAGPQ